MPALAAHAHRQGWLRLGICYVADEPVAVALDAGADPAAISFAGPGKRAPELLQALCESARHALADYNWEGLHQPPRLELGTMGSDARALGGALLPLHACFAPDTDIFLKA